MLPGATILRQSPLFFAEGPSTWWMKPSERFMTNWVLLELQLVMRSQHEKGNKTAGLNVFTGKVVDMWKEGVVEPLRVKIQAISSATEAATMILRIDDVLSGKSALAGGSH